MSGKTIKNPLFIFIGFTLIYLLILNLVYLVYNPTKFYFAHLSINQKSELIIKYISENNENSLSNLVCLSDDSPRGGKILVKELLEFNKVKDQSLTYITEAGIIKISGKTYPISLRIAQKQYSFFNLQILPFYSREFEQPCISKVY